jgi:hypothetical protein
MKTLPMKRFVACLYVAVVAAGVSVAQDSGPEPIKIENKGGPATIPDVARDQVICFALYTVQDATLKLSAQLYPLRSGESRDVTLSVNGGRGWKEVATQPVDDLGWMTTFRVEGWDHSRDFKYRLAHPGGATFEGTVRKDPSDKETIVVGAFTGNSNRDRSMREDVVRNVKFHDPDLLFFSGDQSYDHKKHTAAWLLFGRQFGDIIKDRPTIAIPDDHDVGQGNLWGEGGKVSHAGGGDDGGFIMPAAYVNMVQRAQTSHLPDPFDPTPIQQNISVYYTSLNVGGVDFAIIEDRKWKTGPAGLVPQQGPRADHVNDSTYDPKSVDVPEARLLGDRQLKFLHEWGQDWDGATMKSVLSQTIFAGGAHIHGRHNSRLLADLDSNGWPQSGRARALRELRRCFAFHIAGDQHLATVIQHGVNEWEDAGFSFCVPSIVNFYGRWWWPLEATEGPIPGNDLEFAGRFYDGFKNNVTMHAYANPTKDNFNAAGYGIVRFNKKSREITMECWPRHVDVSDPSTQQYAGWPVRISQKENYGRKAIAYLPTLNISGAKNPVVQVIDEYLGEIVYTLRIQGSTFRPKVFTAGSYTIKISDGDRERVLAGVESLAPNMSEELKVSL